MTSHTPNSTTDTQQAKNGWQFWIDRGGTFTDIVTQRPDGTTIVHKLLSENPERYEDAPIQGIRELMGVADGEPLPSTQIASIKMGTTVATNALLERKGDRTLFITTKGFRDGLRIGYQNRPDIFARHIVLPEMLYEQVVEVDERVSAKGEILQALTDEGAESVRRELRAAYEQGIRACAIAFIHGYRYPKHEQQVANIAQAVGFTQISTSHEVSPLVKWVSRSDTTVVDAYLSPILRRYVDRIEKALGQNNDTQLLFMQSNGGLTPAKYFQGKDSILSGPAGGIVGAVQASRRAGFEQIITFDMGGTSTDVAHYKQAEGNDSSNYERAYETEVAGVRLRSPMMAIHTVAAGGGSVLAFEGDRYRVGPESAGAYPGPACYRNGGPLTVTDCNVMVGKIQPQFFPKVFGADGQQALDRDRVQVKFLKLAEEISSGTGDTRRPEQVAEGFLAIATDNMANAIKKISVQKGYDISKYTLCCFGAAGGQHACRLAESLGMTTVFIHPYAGVLSAYGMGLADRRVLKEKTIEKELTPKIMDELSQEVSALSEAATAELKEQGDDNIDTLVTSQKLQMRYAGTDSTLTVEFGDLDTIQQQFEQSYRQQYGITLPSKRLVVSAMVAEAIGKMAVGRAQVRDEKEKGKSVGDAITTIPLFSADQWHQTPVFQRENLRTDTQLSGPAIILEQTGTNIIEPQWTATVDAEGALILTHQPAPESDTVAKTNNANHSAPDPVRLEIFNSLFQTIAEQMGFTLQNTSSSVNIKERLDFSCAIFDRQGQLVANAPHIPVHLGSMGESVQALIASSSDPFWPGDTFISNNPYNGGTHLPDVTAITPVFVTDGGAKNQANSQPLFFVASRGHHADIGGITPGSMPPGSTHLEQEGVLLDNFKLIEQGVIQSEALKTKLTTAVHPVRNLDQNIADLQAQVAANNKGAQELRRMVQQFGLGTVQAYMQHVQDNAEQAVRRVIQQLYEEKGRSPLTCCVPMDCGATIQVSITIEPGSPHLPKTTNQALTATIDFTGTSAQQPNNFNAPLAVCKAAVLYVFRTLVDAPIPLNAGCLKPLNIVVPDGCLLKPTYPTAVVAGNVETSQAVTDALYGALGVLAASQGTMNNFTFGNQQYQYYETICGGSGAGPTFPGTDAVQTHMTNSRLTDPEILEMRFPVLLEAFAIRENSGGSGKYAGGNGVIRQLRFLEPMTASLLSGRRQTSPFGLNDGRAGQTGYTYVRRQNGSTQTLAATDSVEMQAGDLIAIVTPGGGGYG
ncbi:MAG: hydantoinase B/oxoprolinase family protein [Cyanobacteria bacterium J06560_6]